MPEMWSCALTRHDALASWGPMSRILYRLLVSLARLAVRSGRSKDLEIIVLEAVNGAGHEDSGSARISAGQQPWPSFRHLGDSRRLIIGSLE